MSFSASRNFRICFLGRQAHLSQVPLFPPPRLSRSACPACGEQVHSQKAQGGHTGAPGGRTLPSSLLDLDCPGGAPKLLWSMKRAEASLASGDA